MTYAIVKLGGKQYTVREGDTLLVDRLGTDEGKTFHPDVLLVGGDGNLDLDGKVQVTARVVGHVLGDKVRIGKYRRRTGYRRHTGFRAQLTEVAIEAIGAGKRAAAPAKAAEPKAEPAAKPARQAHPPKGYDELTVAQIAEEAPSWRRPQLEAALAHEQENANRKGAIAALEAALAEKEHH